MIQLRHPSGMSLEQRETFLREWMRDRERGRTDLHYLCTDILGYKDVTAGDAAAENHQPLLDGLHHFSGRREVADPETMRIMESTPKVDMWSQPQKQTDRNKLFLYPRDHLKTSIVTIAHSIQWILNYEDVRILLSVATGVQANSLMDALLSHFRYNAEFRFLYPEFCPPARNAPDFGSREQFTVPNRTKKWIKEPTVMAITIGKIIAGTHQDVHKHSDLVDKENVKTVNQIKDVTDHFGYSDPLLARIGGLQGWRDVEGTRYDFSDLYGTILDGEEKLPADQKTYTVIIRAAEVEAKTKKTLWPARYTWESLQGIRNNPAVGLYIYEAQYNQRCIPPTGGLCARENVRFMPREKIRQLMPSYRIHTTIDLAGMEEQSVGAYCALTTCGFLRSGMIHVIDIRHGHFTPFEVIAHFFDIHKMYRPSDFKMEKNHHAQTLEPFLRQEMDRRGVYLNVLNLPRDNSVSKDNRIQGLQSWFAAKRIVFADDLPCDTHLLMEITRFPKYKYKDILDTLADQLQHADGKGIEPDLHPTPKTDERPWWETMSDNKFKGFDPITKEHRWSDAAQDINDFFHVGSGI